MSISNLPPDDNPDPREGERLRDEALNWFRQHRPALVRHLQREFLRALLAIAPATSDVVRNSVPIPAGVDPRIVGSVVRGLSESKIIVCVGQRKSRRPVAHARKLDLWAVRDVAAARAWLLSHPDLTPDAGEVSRG